MSEPSSTVALRAEWTKLRTVSSTGWALLGIVGCTVAISTLSIMGLPNGSGADTTRTSLTGVYLGQLAVVVLAVLAVTPEYETTMIRTSLAADPRRGEVLGAKAAMVGMLALGAGALGVLGSLVAGWIILPGKGLPLSLMDGQTLRASAGTVLYCGLIALLSVGVALIIRHTGAAVTMLLGLLYIFPIMAAIVRDEQWRKWIMRLAPMPAGLAIQATRDLDVLPIAPWAGLGVLTGYAAAAVLLGAVLFHLRDA